MKQCAIAGCAEQPSLVHHDDNLPSRIMFEYCAAVDWASAMLQHDGRIQSKSAAALVIRTGLLSH